MTIKLLGYAGLCVVMGELVTLSLAAQTRNVVRLSVTDHRPVAEAVVELVTRHRWAVTYEDPFYENLAELQDITWKIAKPGRPTPPKQLFAFEGLIELTYSMDDGPDVVIKALLDVYHKSGHGYDFQLSRPGSMLHVIPSMSRDAGGIPRTRRSRLDVPVTVAAANRTVYEFIEAVLNEVQRVSKTKIDIGFFPTNAFTSTKFTQPVRNDTAQNAIERALSATGRQYTWQLRCSAGTDAGCGLNFMMLPER